MRSVSNVDVVVGREQRALAVVISSRFAVERRVHVEWDGDADHLVLIMVFVTVEISP